MKILIKFKKRKLRKRVKRLFNLLAKIDEVLIALGYSRQRRRQLWRDFLRSPENRKKVIKLFSDIIAKE